MSGAFFWIQASLYKSRLPRLLKKPLHILGRRDVEVVHNHRGVFVEIV